MGDSYFNIAALLSVDIATISAGFKRLQIVSAISDCSAGFGLLAHQKKNPKKHITIDSIKDFYELSKIIETSKETGLVVIGGGVPKNFAQDAILGGDVNKNGKLLNNPRLHKYAIQISVADVRDGSLSSSTFSEACSWSKVNDENEQMVFSEATIALPLLVCYAYNSFSWKDRRAKRFNNIL